MISWVSPGLLVSMNAQMKQSKLYQHGVSEYKFDGHRLFWVLESLVPQRRTLPTFSSSREEQFGRGYLRIELLMTGQHPLGVFAAACVRRLFLGCCFCGSASLPGRLCRGRCVGICVCHRGLLLVNGSPTRRLALGTVWLTRLRKRYWWRLPLFLPTPTSPPSGRIEIEIDHLLDAKSIECSQPRQHSLVTAWLRRVCWLILHLLLPSPTGPSVPYIDIWRFVANRIVRK